MPKNKVTAAVGTPAIPKIDVITITVAPGTLGKVNDIISAAKKKVSKNSKSRGNPIVMRNKIAIAVTYAQHPNILNWIPIGIEKSANFSSIPSLSEQYFSVAGKHAFELRTENGKTLKVRNFFRKGNGEILPIINTKTASIRRINKSYMNLPKKG